ncbi:MAG: fasciclin domain-containing protein [Acidobacteriota bacterium]
MKHILAVATIILATSIFTSAEEFRPIFHPPTSSIIEALNQDPDNFSTLVGLLIKADLKELRDPKASYTILAPTNKAFAKLSPEYFTKLTNDPQQLRQLLLAHLLPGKITFNQMFAPDNGAGAKKNVTKSLRTANDSLAEFQCDEHPVMPDNQHHPLINGIARVVNGDIEGTYSVIQVIDTVLIQKV